MANICQIRGALCSTHQRVPRAKISFYTFFCVHWCYCLRVIIASILDQVIFEIIVDCEQSLFSSKILGKERKTSKRGSVTVSVTWERRCLEPLVAWALRDARLPTPMLIVARGIAAPTSHLHLHLLTDNAFASSQFKFKKEKREKPVNYVKLTVTLARLLVLRSFLRIFEEKRDCSQPKIIAFNHVTFHTYRISEGGI